VAIEVRPLLGVLIREQVAILTLAKFEFVRSLPTLLTLRLRAEALTLRICLAFLDHWCSSENNFVDKTVPGTFVSFCRRDRHF
jgi:hypothetical protein